MLVAHAQNIARLLRIAYLRKYIREQQRLNLSGEAPPSILITSRLERSILVPQSREFSSKLHYNHQLRISVVPLFCETKIRKTFWVEILHILGNNGTPCSAQVNKLNFCYEVDRNNDGHEEETNYCILWENLDVNRLSIDLGPFY
jgi:hypothetical protein